MALAVCACHSRPENGERAAAPGTIGTTQASASATPQLAPPGPISPYLSMLSGSSGLSGFSIDQTVRLQLAVPGYQSFSDVYVGHLLARLSNGDQDDLRETVHAGEARYTLRTGGPIVFITCIGPKSIAQYSDAWERVTHCSKLITSVNSSAATGTTSTALTTARAGIPLEITPLFPPTHLHVGSEFVARFHYLGEKQEHIPVEVFQPDGTRQSFVTTNSGSIAFPLTQSGRWLIRMSKSLATGEKVGELAFDIQENLR